MKAGCLFAAAMAGLLLSACSDDKEAPLPELKDTVFTGVKGLKLYYCGEAMPGKSARLTPDDNANAQLTLYSDFDLSQLSIKGVEGNIPAPGVIPGDISTPLSLALIPGDGYRSFSGEGKSADATFSYSGKVYADSLVMEISDVKLDNLALAGSVWQLSPLVKNEDGIGYKSTPFHIEWDVTPLPDQTIQLGDLLSLAVTVPCIPVYNGTAYSSVAQLLTQLVQTATFLPNGNVVIMYVSTTGGAAHLATLSGNTIQYTVASPQYAKFYVNPLSVAGLAMTSGVAADLYSKFDAISSETDGETNEALTALMPAIKQLMAKLAPQIAGGIPMAYTKTDNSLDLYFDTATAAPVVQALTQALLSDPKIMQALSTELAKYPELAPILPQITEVLKQLPSYLEKTTRFEFGLSLTSYKAK